MNTADVVSIQRRFSRPGASTMRFRVTRSSIMFPAFLAAALGAAARGADDVVVEDGPPAAPAPLPPVPIMPPGFRIQVGPIQIIQGGGVAACGEVRREPYLGLVTGPVSDELRAQLDLPEGIGLTVQAVAADGPADRAGVRRFDVLRKFDEQVVCSPEQLSTFVKAAGKGAAVKLMVIRGGKELPIDVVIDEREVAVGGPVVGPFGPFPGLPGGVPPEVQGLFVNPPPFPGGGAFPGLGEAIRARVQRQVQEALEQAQAGGFGADVAARVLEIAPGGGSQRTVVVSDGRGTVEIRETNGRRTVAVTDPEGRPVHAGPLDTAGDRERVPEAYRPLVEEVEGRLGGPAESGPTPAAEAADEGER